MLYDENRHKGSDWQFIFGKKEINVTDGLAVEFNGVDGYGTARVADEFFWEEEALEAAGLEDGEETENSLRGVYLIETAVEYEVSPDEGLSNGDEDPVCGERKEIYRGGS